MVFNKFEQVSHSTINKYNKIIDYLIQKTRIMKIFLCRDDVIKILVSSILTSNSIIDLQQKIPFKLNSKEKIKNKNFNIHHSCEREIKTK